MLPNNDDELLAQLALTFIEGIGPKLGRILLSHFGSATAILKAAPKDLRNIGGMGEVRAKAIKDTSIIKRAEQEMLFAEKNKVNIIFLTDPRYPARLKSCEDAPLLLFYRGAAPLDAQKVVAVIGTRQNTDYGLRATEDLIDGLQGQENMIVTSGLAYGIDAIAHRRCVKVGLPTVGVVGHGLDRIYPSKNTQLAKDMIEAGGGILAEFPSGTKPDASNFPMRNRVVAGLSDVTVVVESDAKGGAMITAYMAASYNRDVAAFPGRVYDAKSGGPNKLIKMNIASPIGNARDLLDVMNWTEAAAKKGIQQRMFLDLTEDEQLIVNALKEKESVHADDLRLTTGLNNSKLAATLLQLEMMGAVKTLPGKMYRMQ